MLLPGTILLLLPDTSWDITTPLDFTELISYKHFKISHQRLHVR
jgi:hypothetical protein